MTGPVLQMVMGDVRRDARVRKTGRALRDAGHEVVFLGVNRAASALGRILTEAEPLDACRCFQLELGPLLPYDKLLQLINAENPLYEDNPTVTGSLRAALRGDGHGLIDRARTMSLVPAYSALLATKRSRVLHVLDQPLRGARLVRGVVECIRSLEPSVIHAHDLEAFRLVAALPSAQQRPIVYDSHELERGRNAPMWSNARKRRHAASERMFIKRAARVVTVAESIADVLERDFELAHRPTVTVNAPPKSDVRPNRPLRERLRLPEDHRVVVYLGGITVGRGLSDLLQAMVRLPSHYHLALYGSVQDHFIDEWARLVDQANLGDRLHPFAPVPHDDVVHTAWGADAGVVNIEPIAESYEHALPNKFFECTFADVPVVASPTYDMKALVSRFSLGTIVESPSPDALARAIREVEPIPPAQREAFVEAYCWEAQAEKLARLYEAL